MLKQKNTKFTEDRAKRDPRQVKLGQVCSGQVKLRGVCQFVFQFYPTYFTRSLKSAQIIMAFVKILLHKCYEFDLRDQDKYEKLTYIQLISHVINVPLFCLLTCCGVRDSSSQMRKRPIRHLHCSLISFPLFTYEQQSWIYEFPGLQYELTK